MDYQFKKKENLLALTIVCLASHRTSDTVANYFAGCKIARFYRVSNTDRAYDLVQPMA